LRLADQRFTTGGPTTRRQLIHFMANIAHESGFRPISESLGYSATRLTEVWPARFPTVESARPFANNSQALANSIYASRMGNGPPASGDGYRFRGRGWPQLTGRDAYRQVGDLMGLPFEKDPDQLLTLDGSAMAGVGFWHWKACGILADADNVDGVRRRWNGGTIGLTDVRAKVAKLRQLWPA
jgi:putative chitinase